MIRKLSAHSGLVRNILTLFTGSTIAQAIPVMVSPLLTRLYPVTDFATLTVVTTLISLVGVVVAGRYEVGIGLPADDREARQMMYLAVFVSLITATFSFLVIFIFKLPIASLLQNEEAANYLLLVPLAALFYGLYQALSYWNIRRRNYGTLAASRVSQSITNSGISLGWAVTGWGMNGLVFGNVAGHLAALVYTWLRIPLTDKSQMAEVKPDRNSMKRLAKQYADLPRVNGLHALSDMAQATTVIFIISAFFGAIVTGLYGLTIRILQAPLNMIGSSFSIVFYKEVSEKIGKGQKVLKLVRSTVSTLSMISLPVFVVILVWGPSLFAWVFGEEWRDAGLYARILSPWLFLNFIASPISHLPVILNKQRRFFVYSLTGNIMVVLSLVSGAWFLKEVTDTMVLVSATQSVFQLCMIIYFFSLASKSDASQTEKLV
jgi:O-antigen/teichoic acid export membrane protein